MADNYVATRRVLFFFSEKVQRDVSPVCETRSRLLLRSRRGRSPQRRRPRCFFFFPSPANGVIVSVRRRLWLALIRVTWPARRRHVVAAAIWMSFLNPAVPHFPACLFYVLSRFLVCLFVWWLTISVVLCSLPSFFLLSHQGPLYMRNASFMLLNLASFWALSPDFSFVCAFFFITSVYFLVVMHLSLPVLSQPYCFTCVCTLKAGNISVRSEHLFVFLSSWWRWCSYYTALLCHYVELFPR